MASSTPRSSRVSWHETGSWSCGGASSRDRRDAQLSCSVVEPHMRRVVVTGLGVVSPIGIGVDPFWKQLREGVSGVRRITKFDAAGLPSQIAAEVTGFGPEIYLPRRD